MSKPVFFIVLCASVFVTLTAEAVCKTKKNEVYSECTNGGCSARNCSQLGTPVPCVKIDPKYCIKGCICDEGYLRNSNGVCIPKEKCPSCGGDPNAVASECGNDCMNTCAMYNKEKMPCLPVCFENRCECKKGFVLDDNTKKCVQPGQCTPTCKENEVYNSCANGLCRFAFCTQYGQPPMFCMKFDKNNCIGGCICQDNYLRNSDGVCIPKEECPQARCKPEKHELYSDCVNSGCVATKCSQLRYPVPCPKIDANSCIKGCVCEEGYLRDDAGVCVPEEKCPLKCGPNEVLNECANGVCGPKSCSELGFRRLCEQIDPATCKKGCLCKDGFVSDQGECIPKTSCPSCDGDPNAVSTKCGNNCKNTCAMYNSNNTMPCLSFCSENSCACKKNYIYDGNVQKCVLPEQCTATCKFNETYSPCANGLCSPGTCGEYYSQTPMSCPSFDMTKCVCKDNYSRSSDGRCILKEDCPEAKCGANEAYNPCANKLCGPQTCDKRDNKSAMDCMKLMDSDEKDCVGGCVCKDGYLRNSKGNCVTTEEC